jgi:hypothetical protein
LPQAVGVSIAVGGKRRLCSVLSQFKPVDVLYIQGKVAAAVPMSMVLLSITTKHVMHTFDAYGTSA